MSTAQEKDQAASNPMDIAQLRREFKRLRKALGYSQVYVATNLLGVTQASLSAWETGKNQSMRTETINRVFRLVGEWKARKEGANNIVSLSAGSVHEDRSSLVSPVPDALESQSLTRVELESFIRSFLSPTHASFKMIERLSLSDLLDLYILIRIG